MAAKQLMLPSNRAFNNLGAPMPRATAHLYASGGLVPALFYANEGLSVSLGSTLTADGAGYFPVSYQDEDTPFRLIVLDPEGEELDDIDPFFFGLSNEAETAAAAAEASADAAEISADNAAADAAEAAASEAAAAASAIAAGLPVVQTRVVLAGLAATDGMTRYLAEPGREGTFVFDTADYSALVAIDTAQGLYVAPTSDTDGSSGAWVRKFDGPVHVTWFGFSTSASAADNLTAINVAKATMLAHRAYKLYIPSGEYDVGGVIDITKSIEIYGDYVPYIAYGIDMGTVLNFTGDTTGIRVQGIGTSGATATGQGTSGADGTYIHNLKLVGAFVATESEAHGIHNRGKVTVRDVEIWSFSGDGIHNIANVFPTEGNSNGSVYENVVIMNCRWGDYSDGQNANACTFDNVSCFGCRRGGHFDSSYLGNNYYNGDITSCGQDTDFPTCCTYSGYAYQVLPGQEVWCSTNAPTGTTSNNQGWAYVGIAASVDAPVAWTSGLTWYFGAPFAMDDDNNNADSRFVNIYIEAGQGYCVCTWPGMVTHGQQAQGGVITPTGSTYGAQIIPDTAGVYIPTIGAADVNVTGGITAQASGVDITGMESIRGKSVWASQNFGGVGIFTENGLGRPVIQALNLAVNATVPLETASSSVVFRDRPYDWGSSVVMATIDSTGLTAPAVYVDDEAYGAGWNASLEVPTKNAVYDKIEALAATIPTDGDKGDVAISGSGATYTVERASGNDFRFTGNHPSSWLNTMPELAVGYDSGGSRFKMTAIHGGVNWVPLVIDSSSTILQQSGNDRLTINGTGAAVNGDLTVTDEAFASGWNASLEVPTKNAVYDALVAAMGRYNTILDNSGSHVAGRVAGTYGFGHGDPLAISGTGTLYPLDVVYLDPAEYASTNGLTAKLRIRCTLAVNDVAPTGNYVVGLHPVTRPGTSGGAALNVYTIGAAVAGSTVTFTTPAADSHTNQIGADFNVPTAGFYVIGMVSSATVAASSHLHFSALLQTRYV